VTETNSPAARSASVSSAGAPHLRPRIVQKGCHVDSQRIADQHDGDEANTADATRRCPARLPLTATILDIPTAPPTTPFHDLPPRATQGHHHIYAITIAMQNGHGKYS
jgi:hypothetical protein